MAIQRLLVVEDDAEMAAMMAELLQRQGFFVIRAATREQVTEAMAAGRVDLILLDVSLGTDSGVDICAEIRAAQDVPIIMVSALSADHQRMAGYEVGADDYIAKPFNPDLLLARVRAVLRRAHRAASLTHRRRDAVLHFAGWRYDARRDEVTAPGGWQVTLSSRETALLRVFLANPLIPLKSRGNRRGAGRRGRGRGTGDRHAGHASAPQDRRRADPHRARHRLCTDRRCHAR